VCAWARTFTEALSIIAVKQGTTQMPIKKRVGVYTTGYSPIPWERRKYGDEEES
jgi:hypothetical protein